MKFEWSINKIGKTLGRGRTEPAIKCPSKVAIKER